MSLQTSEPSLLPSAGLRILLIKPKHIGDSLLLTPTIVAIKQAHLDAEIWVVVRRGCEGILAGCPEINRLLTVAAVDRHERRRGDFFRDMRTTWQLSRPKFDYVFELGDGHRGRLLAGLARTNRRYSVRPVTPFSAREARGFTGISAFDWETCHRVEKDFRSVAEFLPLPEPIPPLRFDRCFARPWPGAENLADFAVIQIGKRQSVGRWSRASWEEVGRWLLTRVKSIVITSGPAPDETQDALWLCDRLGPDARATLGRAGWPEVADLLYRARLYAGTDTATMHLAAACGCPIVALFGSTWEGHWRPWRAPYRIVAETDETPGANPNENLARAKQRTMTGITPAKVIAACGEMLR
jgi:lipopolysaccharide heptosyltransferase III